MTWRDCPWESPSVCSNNTCILLLIIEGLKRNMVEFIYPSFLFTWGASRRHLVRFWRYDYWRILFCEWEESVYTEGRLFSYTSSTESEMLAHRKLTCNVAETEMYAATDVLPWNDLKYWTEHKKMGADREIFLCCLPFSSSVHTFLLWPPPPPIFLCLALLGGVFAVVLPWTMGARHFSATPATFLLS